MLSFHPSWRPVRHQMNPTPDMENPLQRVNALPPCVPDSHLRMRLPSSLTRLSRFCVPGVSFNQCLAGRQMILKTP